MTAMGRKVICQHCRSADVVQAGLAEIRRISEKTNKPCGKKKVYLVYRCRVCFQYTPCGDLRDLAS